MDTGGRITGYWINDDAKVQKEDNLYYLESNKNVFLSEKEAKSALAMAQISQLMPYYGGAITDEEWSSPDITKFTIERFGGIWSKDMTKEDLIKELEEQIKDFSKESEVDND